MSEKQRAFAEQWTRRVKDEWPRQEGSVKVRNPGKSSSFCRTSAAPFNEEQTLASTKDGNDVRDMQCRQELPLKSEELGLSSLVRDEASGIEASTGHRPVTPQAIAWSDSEIRRSNDTDASVDRSLTSAIGAKIRTTGR